MNKKTKDRYLYKGFYWMVTLNWIKKQIVKSYLGHHSEDLTEDYKLFQDNMERELIIDESKSNYHQIGYVLFALNGSPPKGCAIYQPDNRWLIMINAWGKNKKWKNIIVKGYEEK